MITIYLQCISNVVNVTWKSTFQNKSNREIQTTQVNKLLRQKTVLYDLRLPSLYIFVLVNSNAIILYVISYDTKRKIRYYLNVIDVEKVFILSPSFLQRSLSSKPQNRFKKSPF